MRLFLVILLPPGQKTKLHWNISVPLQLFLWAQKRIFLRHLLKLRQTLHQLSHCFTGHAGASTCHTLHPPSMQLWAQEVPKSLLPHHSRAVGKLHFQRGAREVVQTTYLKQVGNGVRTRSPESKDELKHSHHSGTWLFKIKTSWKCPGELPTIW